MAHLISLPPLEDSLAPFLGGLLQFHVLWAWIWNFWVYLRTNVHSTLSDAKWIVLVEVKQIFHILFVHFYTEYFLPFWDSSVKESFFSKIRNFFNTNRSIAKWVRGSHSFSTDRNRSLKLISKNLFCFFLVIKNKQRNTNFLWYTSMRGDLHQ